MVVSTHLKNVNQIGLSSEVGENHFKLDIFSAQVDARLKQPPLGVGSPRRSNVAKRAVFFRRILWNLACTSRAEWDWNIYLRETEVLSILHFLKRSFEQ